MFLARARRSTTDRNGNRLRRWRQQVIERLSEPVHSALYGIADAPTKGGRGAITTGISWAIM